jgi:hypothetical protein
MAGSVISTAVVDLVALLQAAQDGDGVLDVRLVDQHLLEAPLQRRVLLDVLAVLVERGGADAVQLAAGQRGLEHVAGVHRALGLAGADHGVQLVDEQDDLPFLLGEVVEHGLQALLELAAELGAGDQRAHVQRQQALVFRPSGTSPLTMRWARPSTMAVLPTPGSPISTGLFLVRRCSTWMVRRISSSRPMTGSSLPCSARSVRSMVYFSSAWRCSSAFGSFDRLAAAHLLDGLLDGALAGAGLAQQLPSGALVLQRGEHEQLGADVLVVARLGELVGQVQQLAQGVGHARRRRCRTPGQPLQRLAQAPSAAG